MRHVKNVFYPLVAILFLVATSCTTPDMKVSEGLRQETTAMPVVGRTAFRESLGGEKGFGFGPFTLEDIERGWTRQGGFIDNVMLQDVNAYQKYSFGVTDSGQQKTWFVQAAARRHATTAEVAGVTVNLNKQREFLQVAFRSAESGEWRLALADPGHYTERQNFLGKLSNGTHKIEVFPLYKWEGKSLPSGTALGYEFSRDGHVLASVQTVNNGKVWLKSTLSPDVQMVLASACSALLLYDHLEQESR